MRGEVKKKVTQTDGQIGAFLLVFPNFCIPIPIRIVSQAKVNQKANEKETG